MRTGLHSIAAWLPLVAMLAPNLAAGQTLSVATSPKFGQGMADRQAWETWFAGLSGEFKAGALFWAGQRSLPHSAGCYAAGGKDLGAWCVGCTAAQRVLPLYDARRNSNPEYRLGWNSLSQAVDAAAATPPESRQPPSAPMSAPPQTFPGVRLPPYLPWIPGGRLPGFLRGYLCASRISRRRFQCRAEPTRPCRALPDLRPSGAEGPVRRGREGPASQGATASAKAPGMAAGAQRPSIPRGAGSRKEAMRLLFFRNSSQPSKPELLYAWGNCSPYDLKNSQASSTVARPSSFNRFNPAIWLPKMRL